MLILCDLCHNAFEINCFLSLSNYTHFKHLSIKNDAAISQNAITFFYIYCTIEKKPKQNNIIKSRINVKKKKEILFQNNKSVMQVFYAEKREIFAIKKYF